MQLIVLAAVLGACAAGRLDNNYLPPGRASAGSFGTQHSGNAYNAGGFSGGQGGFSGGQGGFGGGQGGFGGGQGGFSGGQGGFGGGQGGFGGGQGGFSGGHSGAARSQDTGAQILRYSNDNDGDRFNYEFETSNGIRADATGTAAGGVREHGSFGYRGDDGQTYSVTYTADENGYRAQGAHLPTPPPIPDAILKSLEQNARDEAAGISDDGNYRGEGAGGGYGGGAGAAASRQYLAPAAGAARGGSGNYNANSGYHY